ncbi:hypothetical protein Scep_002780 [Stephania cephalantha]|uniref:Uncharacterized protein n=1 Tax=Stephania cephalantha TaxID=152367 RepID=A0AAP0Q674_9MAGN
MATGAEAVAAKAISDVGDHIARQKRLTKDSLVKLLRKAEDAFSALGQSSKLKASIQPLSDSLVQHKLFQHGDKDVRLLVASCFCQVIRILAPDPPYSHEILRDIFKLIISTFRDLVDTTSPYFIRRVKILETVAKLKCCVLMLDIGCTDLVLEMFNVFFSVIRENHQHSQIQAMLSIMILILEEEVSLPLLDVIFRNLLREKVATSASFKLAVSVIENASEKLEPFVQGYLTSAILDRDSIQSELKELHHDVIYEIFQCAPQMLNAVIPNLTHELLTDQVDVRIKAVNLLGKLFAVPGCRMAHEYRQLFVEFLKRLSDKSPEVRICALQSVKAYCISNPSGTKSIEILAALEERLLDLDDKVRAQAVSAVCEIAKSKLKCIPSKLILRATERLRDKKVSVRTNTLQKLLELYRSYCTQCSEGLMTIDDCLEQIPCRILMLCYDKDCKDFRPQRMELLLAEDLFPILLPVEETLRHWTFLFSVFTPAHLKALNSILTQKRRLQMEMLVYLGLRQKEKEIGSEELQIEMQSSLMKMSRSFVDPSKAEECFHKLHKMKDNSIFKDLTRLLDGEIDFFTSHNIRKVFLKRIGDKHPLYEFLGILSAKCSYNIFCSKHVHSIVLGLTKRDNLNKNLEAASVDLLQDIVSSFPSLLRGCEQQLLMLLSEMDSPYIDKLLQMLGKAGSHLTIELSDFYPSLERLCLDGTRLQSKYAVSVIASLSDSSDHWAFELVPETRQFSSGFRKYPNCITGLGLHIAVFYFSVRIPKEIDYFCC